MRAIEHDRPTDLPLGLVVHTFIYGGVIGLLSAALLETWLLRWGGQAFYIGVGLIEEAAKLAVLWWLSRHLPGRSMVDGLVLGASVGFGFASFESAGYALNAVYGSSGLSLGTLVGVEAVRGLMAPVSHGLWTAVVGAVLFRESRNGRFRLTSPVIGAYLSVSSLHALWDLAPGLARALSLYVNGQRWQLDLFGGQKTPHLVGGQLALYQAFDDLILVLLGAIGLVTVHLLRVRALAASAAD
jgi:RsiW-degrading membrane proteinase PrsW (M82 family)